MKNCQCLGAGKTVLGIDVVAAVAVAIGGVVVGFVVALGQLKWLQTKNQNQN